MWTSLHHFEEEWLARRQSLILELSTKPPSLDEEWWRRGRAGSAEPPAGFGAGPRRSATGRNDRGLELDMRKRFARLATGAQPAVVKVLSFGESSGVKKLVKYVSRGGEIAIENERGERYGGQDAPAAIFSDWRPVLGNRHASRDIGLFTVEISWRSPDLRLPSDSQAILKSVFTDRPFAFAVSQAAHATKIEGVVVLYSPTQGRLVAKGDDYDAAKERLKNALAEKADAVELRITGQGHGVRFGTALLRRLVESRTGQVRNDRGEIVADVKAAKSLVQREWRSRLQSRGPRDTIHVLVAAPLGTDATRFQDAVRNFLAHEFRGHRYIFAVHDPENDPRPLHDGGKRPHPHAHAVIATLSDYGDRLKVWISDLARWRTRFAENARANGIDLEMTERRETASSPAYSHKQVRPTNYVGRTTFEGTSAAGQHRYENKRWEVPHLSRSDYGRHSELARQNWQMLAIEGRTEAVRQFAMRTLARFEEADRRNGQQAAFLRTPSLGAEGFPSAAGKQSGNAKPEIQHRFEQEGSTVNNGQQRGRSSPVPNQQGHADPQRRQEKDGTDVQKKRSVRSVSGAAASLLDAIGRAREARVSFHSDDYDGDAARSDAKRMIEAGISRFAEILGEKRDSPREEPNAPRPPRSPEQARDATSIQTREDRGGETERSAREGSPDAAARIKSQTVERGRAPGERKLNRDDYER